MDSAFSIFIPIGGFFVAQIAQRTVVPLLVFALGEKRFASPLAFDGCTLGIAGATLPILPAMLLEKKGMNPFWSLVIIFVGITLYGLVWLWALGLDARQREWRVENNKLLGKEEQEFWPTFVRERQDYTQTDAFNGYSKYFLDLYDDEKKLATNAYNSENEKDHDLLNASAIIPVRRLDLQLVWRAEPRQWAVFYFHDTWTPLLCGPLDKLNEAQRSWWRQWLLPRFVPGNETNIDIQEWKESLSALREAYPDFWSNDTKTILVNEPGDPIKTESRPQNWNDNTATLEEILENKSAEILAMGYARYVAAVREEAGDYATVLHATDGPFVDLLTSDWDKSTKSKSKKI